MLSPISIFRFGVFEVDARRGELRKYGLRIHISRHALTLLAAFLRSPGSLLSREELGRHLMPADTLGDFEQSLNKAICDLRRALGDSASCPRYIETVANQGYRFIPVPEGGNQRPAIARAPRRSEAVAVLPLASEGTEPELSFLAAQITSSLINKLSSLPGLRVLAYSTVKHYENGNAEPQTAGRELGVARIVAGEILRHGEEVIIRVELIETAGATQLCGIQVKQPWLEAANNAEQIADKVAGQLQPVLAKRRKSAKLSSRKADTPPKESKLKLLKKSPFRLKTGFGFAG